MIGEELNDLNKINQLLPLVWTPINTHWAIGRFYPHKIASVTLLCNYFPRYLLMKKELKKQYFP